jgi:hypothetical protein
MTRILLICTFSVITGCAPALAENFAIKPGRWVVKDSQEAHERQVRSMGANRYAVKESTYALPGQWLVITSSDVGIVHYTLDDFISSGLFCRERGGHRWDVDNKPPVCPPVGEIYNGLRCVVCRKCHPRED